MVLNKLAKRQVTEMDTALSQFSIGAAFFTCQSCENTMVPRKDEKQTKLLCLQNIRFFKSGHPISAPSSKLESADSIAVTIKMQKNNQKHNTVIHEWMGNATLCPVLQSAPIIN
jgi:hypothetical protein